LEYPDATDLYIWDYWYYDRLFVEKSLDLDDLLIKDYFPVDVVVPKVLKIYREMLGVRFEEVKRKEGDSLTWHPGEMLSPSFGRQVGLTPPLSRCAVVCGMGARCERADRLLGISTP
jgi:hypothetical protein